MTAQDLNPQQWQAIRHGGGPLMVVAGAGSGKTKVITCRIAHLIRERGVAPENILAITFTNKAADEMQERVRVLLGQEHAVWISTFHSFCLKILRLHISYLGYKNDFVVYDRQDQLTVAKQSMAALQISEEVFPPKTIIGHISGFKNDFLRPEDVAPQGFAYDARTKAAMVYPQYQKRLRENNALDFDDLLMLATQLLEQEQGLAAYYNNRFMHVLVDEFQDTNATQYRLVRLLTRAHCNVCVVGDDDQSIYRWRGANIENILHFEKDYPGATVIKLEENYRSTQNILRAADAVVRENKGRKGKTLWTRNESGDPIRYIRADDETDEAETVCEQIRRHIAGKRGGAGETAILYRTNAQSRSVEDALRRARIPYQVIGGLKFYERKEIKDMLAYVRASINPQDSVAVKRIINLPARGIGKTSLDKIEDWCREQKTVFSEGLRQARARQLVATGTLRKIEQFMELLDSFQASYRSETPRDFLGRVFEQSGYWQMLEAENTMEAKTRLENLRELRTAAMQFLEQEKDKGLKDFLDTTALTADIDEMDAAGGALRLMTLHTCKGLEFETVFIIGMESKLLPHANSLLTPEQYEEERRLCYVGFTRAKKNLWISNARRRRIYNQFTSNPPSEFIDSIPAELLQEVGSLRCAGAGGNGPRAYHGSEAPAAPKSGSEAPVKYALGKKVVHPAFGGGVIIKREGNEDDLKLEIFFQGGVGRKKLAVNHARLIVL